MTKETKDKILTAAVGLFGVVAGAWFQHFFTIQVEREKNIRELRLGAYAKFFDGQAKKLQSEQLGNSEESRKLMNEYELLVKEAKFPIAVYGGKDAVENLAQYFGKNFRYPQCSGSRETWVRDMKIYQSMRREILNESWPWKWPWDHVGNNDLALILFSCTIPN
jgi:hypothetical protein